MHEDLQRLTMEHEDEENDHQSSSLSIEDDEPLFVIKNNDELRNAFRKYRICEESLSLLSLKKKKICAVIAEEMAPLKHEKARLEPALSAYMKAKNQKSVSVDKQLYLLTTKASTKKAQKEDVLASLSGLGIDDPEKVYDLVFSRVKKENPVIKIDT